MTSISSTTQPFYEKKQAEGPHYGSGLACGAGMSWRDAWLCVLASMLLVLGTPSLAEPGPVDGLVRLDGSGPSIEFHVGRAALDPLGQLTIEQAARHIHALDAFDLRRAGLPPGAALWVKLRLQRSPEAPTRWVLEIPMPTVDRVTVFQRDTAGKWQSAQAGDHVRISHWPEPGRYPAFDVDVPVGAPVDLFLRLEHATPAALPLRLVSAAQHDQRSKLEYLVLGIGFGSLVLLVVGALWQSLMLRDRGYAWFAAYSLVSMLSAASHTGVATHLLWGEAPDWPDAAPGCMALLAGALALRMVHHLTVQTDRSRAVAELLRLLAAAGPILAACFMFVPRREWGMLLVGAYLLVAAVLGLAAIALAMRRHDAVGRWMLAGALPLAAAVGLTLAHLFGLVEGSWLTDYAAVLATAWNLPLIKAALNSRMQERRSTRLRQQALASHDPLTGLPKITHFRGRLRRALNRYVQQGEPSALVVVSVANLLAIKVSRGAEVAEECLLRAVIKIQSLVRDVDVVGRVGDSCFGLVLEGADNRSAVSDFASHLVASGLMQDPEHPGDPALHFHVVAVLLNEHPQPTATLIEELVQLLATMSPRTRRPIRYLQPQGMESEPVDDITRVAHVRQVDRIPEVI